MTALIIYHISQQNYLNRMWGLGTPRGHFVTFFIPNATGLGELTDHFIVILPHQNLARYMYLSVNRNNVEKSPSLTYTKVLRRKSETKPHAFKY